jgi:hypothetical protein
MTITFLLFSDFPLFQILAAGVLLVVVLARYYHQQWDGRRLFLVLHTITYNP